MLFTLSAEIACRESPASREMAERTDLIAARILEKFAQSHYASLRRVGCEAVDGSFVLWGSVGSYHTKQLAQVLASSVVELRNIKNRIQVRPYSKAD
jgi:hypothetical protein